jgi:hypothetical protein
VTDLTGIRWLLFGLQLSVVGIAIMAVSGGSVFAAVGAGMIFFGLLSGVIGQFGPSDLGLSVDD